VEVDLFFGPTVHCGSPSLIQPRWQRLHLYAFPLIALLPGVLERVRRDGISLLLVAPLWQALNISPSVLSISKGCLEFAPGNIKSILYPRAGYLLKVPFNATWPMVLQAFYPPPHVTADEQRLHLLCLMRALKNYI